MKTTSLFAIAALAACSSSPAEHRLQPPSAGKGDSSGYTVLGSLSYGQSSGNVYFSGDGYAAYTFSGNAGDNVSVSITDDAGAPVSYLLDGNGDIVASGADSMQTTLASADTYSILFADQLAYGANFSVALSGGAASCTTDADCAFLSNGDPTQVPECGASHTCALVPVDQVHCLGFTAHPHQCPDGYRCHFTTVPDVPGRCVVDGCAAGCDASQLCCFTWGVGGPATGSYECAAPVNNACPLNL
jgi:hypothetical protein